MKYIDRGAQDTMVLIPGWATDYRIFNMLELPFNYLLPLDFSPAVFNEKLIRQLKERSISKVSVFGWSLGGFMASDFAARYPELVDRLILISIRDSYTKEEISHIKDYLRKNKRGYLYKFYTSCFSKDDDISWFRKNLLKEYCEMFNLDYLISTLDYLADRRIDTGPLREIERIEFIHGEHDKIAPIKEARQVLTRLPQAKFIRIENAGHMPFFNKGFVKEI